MLLRLGLALLIGGGFVSACDDALKIEPASRSVAATPPTSEPQAPASSTEPERTATPPTPFLQLPPQEDSASAQGVAPGKAAQTEDPSMKCETFDLRFKDQELEKNLRGLRIGKPDGREVLLLHGGRFNCRTWLETGTLEFLAKNGCRAVAIDLPGFGKSDAVSTKPEAYLALALPLLELKKPVLVFPSMSGAYALPFAIDHKELLAGLVAVAPVGIDDYAPKLKGLELPALVIWGEKDTVIPLSKAEMLHQLLMPNSTKVVIPGAGHPCYQDEPQQFHAALLRFLQSLGPVAPPAPPKPPVK